MQLGFTKGAFLTYCLILLTVREDCRFHGIPNERLSHCLADPIQELLRLFSVVKVEGDIAVLQKRTILDDDLPDVQAFIESRSMQVQLLMWDHMSFGL